MGQRGVHATITQDERTGLVTVNHVTVQWSIHIAQIIQFALQHAGKDGYTQDEFLNLLKKTVADMEHISAFNCSDEDDTYYDRHGPMEGYCFVAHNYEDGKEYRLGIDDGDGSLLTSYKESERCSIPRAFAKRKAAEKFIKEHGHAQDAVSYLWDLDTNQFTFFTVRGALEAYDFATGETVTCKEITYSLDQLRHPNASVKYNGRMSSKQIIRLYEGALPTEPPAEEESESDIALRAYKRLPLQWPGGDTPTHARIALLNRSAAQYAVVVCAEGKEFPANLLTVDQTLEGRVIDRNPFVYDPHVENDAQPAYVVTDFSGNPQIGGGEWEFSKISAKTGRVDLNRTYKTTGSLDENTLDDLFNQALQNGAQEPTPLVHPTPEWAEEFITAISTDPWTVADVEQWSHICRVAGGYPFPDLELDKQQAQKAFEESASKYGAVLDTNIVPFPKEKELESRLRYIQKHWPTTDASEEQQQIHPSEIEIARICDGTLVAAYVKPWKRTIVVPMCDALDKIVYRAMSTVEAAGLNAPTSSTVLRVTSPKNTESVICSVFSPAWARALAPEGATAKAPTLEQWMQYC